MQHVKEGHYLLDELIGILDVEAKKASNYISSVIHDDGYFPHVSEYFSDVVISDVVEFEEKLTSEYRKTLWGRHGIYVFVIKEDFTLTYKEVWDYCEKCKAAGFQEYHDYYLKKGQHFYQGSATSLSLYSRLNQHFSTSKTVSSMHLNHPSRVIVKDKLTVYVFPMRKVYKNYKLFSKMVEEKIHERYHPITGSTRV